MWTRPILGSSRISTSFKQINPAKALTKKIGPPVHYAPYWVRVLSAVCLGVGTMIGYKRVARTSGERLGKEHMTPGQGGSAELTRQ